MKKNYFFYDVKNNKVYSVQNGKTGRLIARNVTLSSRHRIEDLTYKSNEYFTRLNVNCVFISRIGA